MALTHKVVTDLETLKAISHPLRMELLGALRPTTSASSSGSAS
jgi:hypothetical protein